MLNEQTLKVLERLKTTQDGIDYIHYLEQLSNENYQEWKAVGGDVLRGKAVAIDQVIKDFKYCTDRLSNRQVVDGEWI